ncbi:hypothetical protein [Caballeronia sordidicola]|uniref:hypothetical protein n=1 Tax=Caballeronia sordidicola TaxID=196367 RepID=UPI000A362F3A|nr:hypothetical protein [Caballeronia sordidicola]
MTATYIEKLHAAYDFTEKLGASFTRLPTTETEFFTGDLGERLQAAISNKGITSFAGAAGQCVKWSHALRPLAEEILGAPILLTFGQVINPSRAFFNPSWADLQNWHQMGFSASDFEGRSGINLHSWWTLPSGEVMDVTLWSTLSDAWNRPELLGAVTGGWPDKIAPNPTYVPMVVGDDYIETVERHMPFSRFLARECTLAELNAMPVMMIKT